MPFIPQSVGELRSELGDKRPLSRFELAKMVGVTEQTIKNWESGRGTPRMEMLDRLTTICVEKQIKRPIFYRDPC